MDVAETGPRRPEVDDEPMLEVAPEELAAALGKPMPKWLPLAAGVVGVAGLAALVFFGGAEMLKKAVYRSEESGQVELSDTAGKAAAVVPPAPALPDSAVLASAAEDGGLSEAERELIDETYFKLLNAAVSPDEARVLEDSVFYRLLFTPLVGQAQPPFVETDSGVVAVGQAVPPPAGVSVDTTRWVKVVDSLNVELENYRKWVAKLRKDSAALAQRPAVISVSPDTARQADIRKLAKILDTMDPGAAASMLAGRSSQELQEILFRLKPRTAAKIVQKLPPEKRGQLAAKIVSG